MNDENQKTELQINHEDQFLSRNIKYHIAGEFTLVDTTKSYEGNAIKMIDNYVAHLFSHREVKKHNATIDK